NTGKPGARKVDAQPGEIIRGESYEEHAIEAVSNFLRDMERYPEGHPNHLSQLEAFSVADRALSAVHAFHIGDLRKGDAWQPVRTPLMARDPDVLSDELKALIDLGPREKAEILTRGSDVTARMKSLFEKNPQAQRDVVMWDLAQAEKEPSARDPKYLAAA